MLNRDAHDYYSRSSRGYSRPWECSDCHYVNFSVPKRLYYLPAFNCMSCGRDFFQDNDLDFCLADIKVNGTSLVPNIMHQRGPECVAYASCQMMRMRYLLDTALKNKAPDDELLELFDPVWMLDKYECTYRKYKKKPTSHKWFKIWESLRSEGIELDDGSVYKIGDVSFTDRRNYNAICEMLADGEPVMGVFLPGVNIRDLSYGQFYRSPEQNQYVRDCANLLPGHSHPAHAVVLVGPRTHHKTGDKGFWFVNSWDDWCSREENVISKDDDIVEYGVGIIAHDSLCANVVRFWQPGQEAAPNDPMKFQKEPEDGTTNAYNSSLWFPPN